MRTRDLFSDDWDEQSTSQALSPPPTVCNEFEFAPDAQIYSDCRGRVLLVNRAAATLFQRPKELLTGKCLGLFLAEENLSRYDECLSRLSHGLVVDRFETRLAHSDSEFRDVHIHVAAANALERGDSRTARVFHWLIRDMTELKRLELIRLDLLQRLTTVREEERQRISRELHDSIGQLVAALALALQAVRDASPPQRAEARLSVVEDIVHELGRAAHDLAVLLRPTALNKIGLDASLRKFLTAWSHRTGIPVAYEAAAIAGERAPAEVETAVFRVVQEALTNVARHSQACTASVAISRYGDQLTVSIEDDGVGFDPEILSPDSLGLIGMRERVDLALGKLQVESAPGKGTTILARFPLQVNAVEL